MKIESLSIKSSTVAIFSMIAVIAIVTSLFAGRYFKQAALDAQMNSLSRVIEVASMEMLKQIQARTFDLGMKLGYSNDLISAIRSSNESTREDELVKLLDDPFVSGFVGFSDIDLLKIRIFNLQMQLIAESSKGPNNLGDKLPTVMSRSIGSRKTSDRLKAVDALWISKSGPLYSTLVPLGGLRPIGYLEIIVDPVFNLPDIGKITRTPVNIYDLQGRLINSNKQDITTGHLPVEFTLYATNGKPAFIIAGYENIDALNLEMGQTQISAISGFLVLSLATLLFAIWLFNRFLFSPVSRMIADMQHITNGKLELIVNNKGLKEFHILADAFNAMTEKLRMRTNDLQRLLDLDDSALMCFDNDHEAVYFNKSATSLFAYDSEEIIDLESNDLFTEDIQQVLQKISDADQSNPGNILMQLTCKHKDGHLFNCAASINTVNVMGKSGFAIALNPVQDRQPASSQSDQRLNVVERTLGRLLDFAKENPDVIAGLGQQGVSGANEIIVQPDKLKLREQVVKVMSLSLACWQYKLGKTKLELAEQSHIWPVYMDKSTPTTRTLDRYLNIESCPKNPRSQRAVDTAEFVIRNIKNQSVSEKCTELHSALESLRILISGIKSADK